MNIFAAAGTTMIFTAAGAVFSSVLKQRCEQLRCIAVLIDEIAVKIRYRSVRMTELMNEIICEETYSRCTFVKKLSVNIQDGMQIKEAWNASADKAAFLSETDRVILRNIGAQLGDSDTEGQLSMLTVGEGMIRRSLEAAEDDMAKRSRTLLSVWTLCGIGAGIIIL